MSKRSFDASSSEDVFDSSEMQSQLTQLCQQSDDGAFGERKRSEIDRIARTAFGVSFAPDADSRTMCRQLLALFEVEKRSRSGPAPCINSRFVPEEVTPCARAVAEADPERYGWLNEVAPHKLGPALCMIGVREFGYSDEEIKDVPAFCDNLRRDIQQATSFSEKIASEECPICMNTMNVLDTVITECGHTGHKDCMQMAITSAENRCPMCKRAEPQIVPLTALARFEREQRERGPPSRRRERTLERKEREQSETKRAFARTAKQRVALRTEFFQAVRNGDIARLRQIAHEFPGFNPNIEGGTGNTALMMAATRKSSDTLKSLKELFPDIDPNIRSSKHGYTALILAAGFARAENVKTFKELFPNINPNIFDNDGLTALMMAVKRDDVATVKALKEFDGIDVNQKKLFGLHNRGWTALMFAVYHNTSVVRALKEFPGIDPNVQNDDGKTALMDAVYSWDLDTVRQLESFPNIDPNVQDHDGNTALMLASSNNDTEKVALLKSFPGVDPNVKNKDGKTALELTTYGPTRNALLAFPGIIVPSVLPPIRERQPISDSESDSDSDESGSAISSSDDSDLDDD